MYFPEKNNQKSMDHPPYEKVTPIFWKKRSDHSAYQKAYKLLAQKISPEYQGKIVDVACGTGRLISKLCQCSKNCTIVGTDSSEEMLLMAHEYLLQQDVHVKICQNASQINFERPGVYLVKDNIVESALPSSFFERTFFTFHELGDGYSYSPENGALVNRAISEKLLDAGTAITEGAQTTLKADFHLARITKPKGQWIGTHYHKVEKKKNSSYNQDVVQWQKKCC